jgi:hypothetical protein
VKEAVLLVEIVKNFQKTVKELLLVAETRFSAVYSIDHLSGVSLSVLKI